MIKLSETQDTQLPDGLYLIGVAIFNNHNLYEHTEFFEVIVQDMTEDDSIVALFREEFPQYKNETLVTTTVVRLKD